jgi:hypothetical protein
MSRPRADDASQNGLVEFDPIAEEEGADEIYEVELNANPAFGATPTPGALIERQATPGPPEPPSPGDLRASIAGRHREIHDDRRHRRGTSPWLLMGVSVLGLGCAGVLTAITVAFTLAGPSGAGAERGDLEAPKEFGGVPVERGLRRGDGPARGPAPRPNEPTP